MKPLAQKAIAATIEGRVKFHPERWTNFYLQWLHNVRDWCISRQLWWGHQIPIWYAPDGTAFCGHSEEDVRSEAEQKLGKGVPLRQDPDVLDTWFSSDLWPFSTLGWPDPTPELDYYYPTSTLVTAREIIFFWVARMVMMGEEVMGREPFSDVYINGTILDRQGHKMSKSAGNGIDPVAVIDGGVDESTKQPYTPHGADGVRFSLTTLSTEGQDLKLWPERFEDGQRFLTKLWNAGRFALLHLSGGQELIAPKIQLDELKLEDRWILSRLGAAIRETTDCLEGFRYCDAAKRIRSFAWDDFCDWYVEVVKLRFTEDTKDTKASGSQEASRARRVLVHVLDALLRLLHPVCPFITEEIWHLLGEKVKDRSLGLAGQGVKVGPPPESVMIAAWPSAEGYPESSAQIETFSILQDIVRRVRKIRQERNIREADTQELLLSFGDPALAHGVTQEERLLRKLARVEVVRMGTFKERPPRAAVELLPGIEVILPLPAADVDKEREELTFIRQRDEGKLKMPSFVQRAPADVVEGVKKRIVEVGEQLRAIDEQLERLEKAPGA